MGKGYLLVTRAVEENIKKVRRAFFHYVSTGVFQVDLSPLSCRCVLVGFLRQVIGREGCGLSVQVRESFCDEISSLSLVKECEELEKMMTRYTENIVRGEVVELREVKEKIRKNDRQKLFSQCVEKSPLIAEVAKDIGWSKLWDTCLSFRENYTTGLQKLSRVMSYHGRGRYPCPLCENSEFGTTVMEHIMECHKPDLKLEQNWTVGMLTEKLRELNI